MNAEVRMEERMAEVAVLLNDLDRKMEEVEAIRTRLKIIMNPGGGTARKPRTQKPENVVRRLMQ